MWLSFTFCASNSTLQPATGEGGRGGEQAAYGLESLGGNTNLQSTIPKPQQPPLYHFSVPLRNSLRKFCSLLKLQMCDIDMLSVLQATLTPFSLLPVNKYWICFLKKCLYFFRSERNYFKYHCSLASSLLSKTSAPAFMNCCENFVPIIKQSF